MTTTTTTIRIGELAAHMTADPEIPQSVRASVEALCALSAIPVVALPPDAAPQWADLWPEWRQLIGRVVQHHEASACCHPARHEVLRAVLTYAVHAARVAMHPTDAARDLAHALRACGSVEGAIARFRGGSCRPGPHTAYVARVAALAARLGGGR